MKTTIQIFAFLFLFSFSIQLSAQKLGEIRGIVSDEATAEPIVYTQVKIEGDNMKRTTRTDLNGFFLSNRIPGGEYRIIVKYFGYDSFSKAINLKEGERLNLNIKLTPASKEIDVTVITGERENKEKNVNISKVEITPQQIQSLPSIGGEPDIAQYLQVLPGVVFTGDQGGQLYIRGGSPIQNKILLDGMTIYNPFHSIGLFSVFDVDIIKSADVYTGGFDASYGGRISAIMDITTRDGDKNKMGGKISVSPFSSKILVETPLQKYNDTTGGSSILLTARNSYLTQTAPIFYSYAGDDGLPYNFLDFYGKYSLYAPSGSKFSVFGFRFQDDVKFPNTTNYNWNSFGIGSKVFLLPSSSSTTLEANIAYSRYFVQQIEQDLAPRQSAIGGIDGGLDFTYFYGNDIIKYGVDLNTFSTDFSYTNSSNRLVEQRGFMTEIAGYARYSKIIGNLVLDPSIRLHYYASFSEFSPEPRISAKYVVNDWLRFKASGGLFSQNLLSAQSDRDVVNLFYGFLSSPDNLPRQAFGEEVDSRLQTARHTIFGAEIDITKNLDFQVEAYNKNFTQLTNINRNKIFDNTPAFADKPEYLKTDYIIETGFARGLDFNFKYTLPRFYVWATYSLSEVERTDELGSYNPHWDRRHNSNIIVNYNPDKKKTIELSLRFNYGSGFPFTRTVGFYEYFNFQEGINTNYISGNGDLGIIYEAFNEGRLIDYHRLDVSAKKDFIFTEKSTLSLTLSVVNAYNRVNIFYFDRIQYKQVNQLPIMPSLALQYSF